MSATAVARSAMAWPFSLEGFEAWIDENELVLDNGDDWVLEGFQREIAADMLSRVREGWAILPEGNAKTTLSGGIGLYMGDLAHAPWIPIGAASRDQAEIMFGQMASFIEGSKSLKQRFRVFEGYRKIRCPHGGRGIKVYPWDPKTGDGVIPFPAAFTDELHRHEDLRLYRLWKGKLLKRGAVIRAISTAGEPGSDFEELREGIRNNAVERERTGCHLRAVGRNIVYHEWMVPSADQANDLEVVKEANPLSTITVEDLVEKRASDTLDFGEDWLRLTCNIPARSSQAAIPEATWDALEEKGAQIPMDEPIWVGADFGWLHDSTAIVPLWIRDPDYRLFGDPWILHPPGGGLMLDVEEVKNAFRHVHGSNPIDVVVLDKSRAEDVAQWLESEIGCTVVDHQQGTEAQVMDYDAFMAGLREKKIRHTGHREFRQHVLNAVARVTVGDKRRFDRPEASRAQRKQKRRMIDALMAAAMAHCVATEERAEVFAGAW